MKVNGSVPIYVLVRTYHTPAVSAELRRKAGQAKIKDNTFFYCINSKQLDFNGLFLLGRSNLEQIIAEENLGEFFWE